MPAPAAQPGAAKGPGQRARPARWHVGLMTGTALDGLVDAALLRTDGAHLVERGPSLLHPYGEALRRDLARAVAAARAWSFQGPAPAVFAEVTPAYTDACADAVVALLARAGLTPQDVAAVGLHGQTVLHRRPAPADGRRGATLQLGDPQRLATRLGIDVIFDFRQQDVAAGGQGAPLAPVYHAALLASLADAPLPAAVLNLGGVANLTWTDGDTLHALDTGPANGPLNDWVERHGLGTMDRDGALARRGRVDGARVAALLDHPYFALPPPKSLDRYDFPADLVNGLGAADGAATLTAFAAEAVALALRRMPAPARLLVLTGGGRRNPALREAIAARTGVPVHDADALGWRGDAIEAECFAFLAARHLAGLPLSFPTTTGVPRAQCGGRLFRPRGADPPPPGTPGTPGTPETPETPETPAGPHS